MEPMMSDTPITERQWNWLDHIRAAHAVADSIGDYARSEGLKPEELWAAHSDRRGDSRSATLVPPSRI
jgi:hypothetical protein